MIFQRHCGSTYGPVPWERWSRTRYLPAPPIQPDCNPQETRAKKRWRSLIVSATVHGNISIGVILKPSPETMTRHENIWCGASKGLTRNLQNTPTTELPI